MQINADQLRSMMREDAIFLVLGVLILVTGLLTLTLVALIEYADNKDYHAGPNRRFMAVTKRLAPQ